MLEWKESPLNVGSIGETVCFVLNKGYSWLAFNIAVSIESNNHLYFSEC